MIKFAETYFRLEIHLDNSDQLKLQNTLLELAKSRVAERFDAAIEVAVYIEDGSIRGWIPFARSLVLAVATYGGLRDGIDYIVRDGRWLCDEMLQIVRQSGIPEEKILRTERRTGVAGKIKRTLNQADRLEINRQNMSKIDYEKELTHIRGKLQEVLWLVDNEEERAIFLENLPKGARAALPQNLPRPIGMGDVPLALKPQEFESFEKQLPPRLPSSGGLIPVFSMPAGKRSDNYTIIRSGEGFRLEPK